MRKILIAVAVLVVLAGGAVVFVGPPKVPAEAIEKSVKRDAALMDIAWQQPVAQTYKRELYWQKNGSYCGPASLVNALRSLGQEMPSESAVVEGSGKCQLGFCFMGLTLDELQAIAAAKTKAKVSIVRDLDAEGFRQHMVQANDPKKRYLVNFNRKPIFGAGGGHHSPIAAYLPEQDLVLVLDVNESFKPWLVERERLFNAIDTVDSASGKKRGLLILDSQL